MTKAECACAFFADGYNCGQSVFLAFCEDFGVQRELAQSLAAGLGGGFRSGEICGAASGAALVIGLKYASAGDKAAKAACNAKTTEFMRQFHAQNGAMTCRELLKTDASPTGENAAVQLGRARRAICLQAVQSAVELLEAL